MIDAIETARQRASALHDRALAAGVDTWKPLEHVEWQVKEAGLGAEPIAPDASQLNGALACFLPVDGLILYQSSGTDFERAFLIAHELGHALLGDAAIGNCEIDPERSAEASPIGEERVIEHGPRQRREVQMDLFARELLLPRKWVRTLHLVDELTAEAIAGRLGAPRAMVVQQLLDALMLPGIEIPASEGKEWPLNAEQQLAADHRGVAYLLEAGPGTGKTQTLTARVSGLLADTVDPRNILVLTFSNKAAAEMSERISRANGDAFAAMWIGTFHAFGLDLLRAFGDRLGLSRNPALLDRTDAVAMLEDELPGLELTHYRDIYDPTPNISDILAAISRAKDEVCDPERYMKLAEAMIAKAGALDAEEADAALTRAEKAREVAVVYARYEELKRERNQVDFGDLVMLSVKLLEEDDEVAANYREKYRHLLIDEYQDVNRASVRLLKALCPSGEGLWAVGDVRQSIYRFRGASSHNISLFEQDFPGAKTSDLITNYRSFEEIVALYSGFAKSMAGAAGGLKALNANRGKSGELPELHVIRDKPCIAPAIADEIAVHRNAGGDYRDHCVLVSGNDRLADIGSELESLGIPVLYLGSLFERPEIKELLSLLSFVSDPRGVGLVRTACMPEFKMSLADVDAALSAMSGASADGATWRDLAGDSGEIELSPGGKNAVGALRDALSGFDLAASPWHILATVVLDRTRIAARVASSTKPRDVAAGLAIWQFMNFLRAQPLEWPAVPKLLAKIRRLLRLADERDLRQLPAAASGIDAVRLMTIHGSKGLEFPVVHLPGLNSDTMPKRPRAPACPPPDGMIDGAMGSFEDEFFKSHNEEQDCLFYVAMSRARDRLRLYRCSHTSKGTRPESSFVPRLGPLVRQVAATPSRALAEDESLRPVPIDFEDGCSWEAWNFDTYTSCPRRLLYEHVLGVRGAVERTPYRRVHDAVRKLCASIVEAGGMPDDQELHRLAHEACNEPHLKDHGYFEDFKGFAVAMVQYFGRSRRGLDPVERQVLSIEIGGDCVQIMPDDVLRGDAGHLIRSVRTGHFKKNADEKFTARALVIAAQQAFPNATVQILHLADGLTSDVEPKRGQEARDRGRMENMLASMRAGSFPAKPSSFTCPGCSALFICDALPSGALKKKI